MASNKANFIILQLTRIFGLLVYMIATMVPKKKGLRLFGAWFGQDFSDNPKYIFLYAIKNHANDENYWLTKSKKIYDEMVLQDLPVVYCNSIRGVWLQFRAEAVVFSHSHWSEFIPFCLSRRTKRVQAWHGSPLKKIGKDDTYSNANSLSKKISNFAFPYLKERFDLVLATGAPDKSIFESAFDTCSDKVVITGYPRNDILPISAEFSAETPRKLLYLPTFRGKPGSNFKLLESNYFDIDEIDKYLLEKNCTLDIKLHPVQKVSDSVILKIRKSKCIDILTEKVDLYLLLGSYHGLITDYSSIFIDALVSNLKIYMLPIDMDEYLANDRLFYFNYLDVCPSEPAKSWRELLSYIFNEQYPVEQHLRMRNYFHLFCDGKSAPRSYVALCK